MNIQFRDHTIRVVFHMCRTHMLTQENSEWPPPLESFSGVPTLKMAVLFYIGIQTGIVTRLYLFYYPTTQNGSGVSKKKKKKKKKMQI